MQFPSAQKARLFLTEERRNLFLIFSALVFLLFVYYLPAEIKEAFVLHLEFTNFADLYMMHFVHFAPDHIFINAFIYAFSALLTCALLYLTSKDSKLFLRIFFKNLIIFPPILSLFQFFLFNKIPPWAAQRSFGFSAIAAAFLGSLVFSCILILDRIIKIRTICSAFFCLVLAFFIFSAVLYVKDYNIILPASAVLVTAFAFFTAKFFSVERLQGKKKTELFCYALLVYSLTAIFCIFLFPLDFRHNGEGINIHLHYLGFIFGLIAGIALKLKQLPPALRKERQRLASQRLKISQRKR
jgi:hypothetical protein